MPLPELRPKSSRTPTSSRYKEMSSSVNHGGVVNVESSYRDIIREKLNNSSRNMRNDSRQSIDLSLNAEKVSRPQSRISFNQEINSINNDFNNRLSDRHQASNNKNNNANQRREISSNRNRQVIFYNRTYVPSASDTNNETKSENNQDLSEANSPRNAKSSSRRNERLNESPREQNRMTSRHNAKMNSLNDNNDLNGLTKSRSGYLSSSTMSGIDYADENTNDYEQRNAQYTNTHYSNRQKSALLKNDQTDFNAYLRASSKRNKSSSNRFSLNIDHFTTNNTSTTNSNTNKDNHPLPASRHTVNREERWNSKSESQSDEVGARQRNHVPQDDEDEVHDDNNSVIITPTNSLTNTNTNKQPIPKPRKFKDSSVVNIDDFQTDLTESNLIMSNFNDNSTYATPRMYTPRQSTSRNKHSNNAFNTNNARGSIESASINKEKRNIEITQEYLRNERRKSSQLTNEEEGSSARNLNSRNEPVLNLYADNKSSRKFSGRLMESRRRRDSLNGSNTSLFKAASRDSTERHANLSHQSSIGQYRY